MKTIIVLLFTLSSTAFAGGQHPFDPLPPSCSAPMTIDSQTAPGMSFCCSTKVTFVAPPAQECPGGYTIKKNVKPKPAGTTYYYCCKMNNPNPVGHDPKKSTH